MAAPIPRHGTTLLLVDTIQDLEFPEGPRLLPHALEAAEPIRNLAGRARKANVPVVYANDNFGRWRDSFAEIVEHCRRPGARGRELVERLRPEPTDLFLLKPKHSAFHATPLDVLLGELETERLVLAGFSGDMCVLFTAIDAHMRELEIVVPRDATASVEPASNERALDYLREILGVSTPLSSDVDFGD